MVQHNQEFLGGLILLSNIFESLAFEKFTNKFWFNKRDVEEFGKNIKGINLAQDEFRNGIMNNLPEVKRYLQRELLENSVWLKKNSSEYFTEKNYAKSKVDFPRSRYLSPLDNIPYVTDNVREETTNSYESQTILSGNVRKRETKQTHDDNSFRKLKIAGETRIDQIKNKFKDDLTFIKNPETQLQNQNNFFKNIQEAKKQEDMVSQKSKTILEAKAKDNTLLEEKEAFPGLKQTESYFDVLTLEPAGELSKANGNMEMKSFAEEIDDYDDDSGAINYEDDDFSDGDAFTVPVNTRPLAATPPNELLSPSAVVSNTHTFQNSLILKTNISLFAIWFVGIFILTVFLTCGCFYIFVICLDSHEGNAPGNVKCKPRCKPQGCNQECIKEAPEEGAEE